MIIFKPGLSLRKPGYPGGTRAFEVLLPDDRTGDVAAKVHQWLAAGCGVVWVVDPDNQIVTVYQDTGQMRLLKVSDELTGGDVVDGFTVGIGDIFGGLGRPAGHETG